MIKVIHIISGLSVGGAETMLFKLVSRMDPGSFENYVISLSGDGPMGSRLGAAGIPVYHLDMKSIQLRQLLRLSRLIKDLNPDIIQTWMYHSDLIGGLAGRVAGKKPIIWNIRHGRLPSEMKRRTHLVGKAVAALSGILPAEILCCSQAAKSDHVELGYPPEKITVIPNGFDLDALMPVPEARSTVRVELGIDDETPLIGMIARFDFIKHHENFAKAAGILHQIRPGARFLLCGDGMDNKNSSLVGWLEKSGALQITSLLGRRTDILNINAALDLATLSSRHEGFPNALGESMACQIPCVVTDVGDCALIVGSTGLVVPSHDPCALATAWDRMLSMSIKERTDLGIAARQRIRDRFSMDVIVQTYSDVYRKHANDTESGNDGCNRDGVSMPQRDAIRPQ